MSTTPDLKIRPSHAETTREAERDVNMAAGWAVAEFKKKGRDFRSAEVVYLQ